MLLLLLIAANVIASILETEPEWELRGHAFFVGFEWFSVAVFSVEYGLRLWSCTADPRFAMPVRGRLRLMLRPMSLVDLAAILPFYLELLLPGTLDLRFLRALRLLRFFRLLRSSRIANAFSMMVRVLQGKRVELAVSFAIVVVAMLVAAGALYVAERNEPGTPFTSIPRSMWWAVETISTIGYGDMIPTTAVGRVVAGLVAIIGICAVALPVGIVSSGFIDEINRSKQARAEAEAKRSSVARCPHCGLPPDMSAGS